VPEYAYQKPDHGSGQTKPKTPFHDLPRSQQAGILCGDAGFQEWLARGWPSVWASEQHGPEPKQKAAYFVRAKCWIDSRAQLGTDPEAAQRWDKLLAEYEQAVGRTPEVRG
jgi:hypothetical protein